MVTLYEFPVSPFCDKVRRAMHVKGVAYRSEPVPLLATVGWYRRRVNPARKVPALVHAGRTIVDSTAIAEYLEATFPGPSLFPDDPVERARCHILEDWADESLYFYQKLFKFMVGDNASTWVPRFSRFDSAFGRAVLARVLVGRQARQLDAQGLGRKPFSAIEADLVRLVGSVDAMLSSREWLVGERLSLADIAVFAQLDCLRGSPEGAVIVDRFADVSSWLARVDALTRRDAPLLASCA